MRTTVKKPYVVILGGNEKTTTLYYYAYNKRDVKESAKRELVGKQKILSIIRITFLYCPPVLHGDKNLKRYDKRRIKYHKRATKSNH